MRRRLFGLESAGPRGRRKSASRPRIEALEDRRLLTTFFVLNTNDNGEGSLRKAILDANGNVGSDVINFNISGTGVHTISLTTGALPTITDTALLDASSQPTNGGPVISTPLIELDGSTLPAGTNDGLTINLPVGTSPSTIRGIAIGGFTGSGVVITGVGGNAVQQSLIGVNADGTAAKANAIGILINGSANNSIGGLSTTFRNVISGNTGPGVSITGATSSGNAIQGNIIGTDLGGTVAIRNANGIVIASGASNNTIGGAIVAARNVISGNTGVGVLVTDTGSAGNSMQGNYIGLTSSGTAGLGNAIGVELASGATGNSIGGSSVSNRNIISGNTTSNILIVGSTNNVVVGNTVGLNADGSTALGGTQASTAGIELENGAIGNTIGGVAATANNVIAGSTGPGIQIRGQTGATGTISANNLVQGNFVGTNLPGSVAVANGGGIVLRDGTTGNTVGGTAGGLARNVVSGNTGAGVSLLGTATTGNIIQSNLIGLQSDGVTALANTGDGVFVDGATNSQIGGTVAGAANTIANNAGAGVFVNTGTGISIRRNSIFGNTGLGIDLAPKGVNQNVATNPGVGPNNLQNYPVITGVVTTNNVTTVTGTLHSAPSTSYSIEIYSNTAADPSGNGQGKTFVGSTNVTTDASGNATFTTPTTAILTVGSVLSATATDGGGNTSEFSADVANVAPTADTSVTITASPAPFAIGGQITYTIVVSNAGPSAATNLVVTDTLPTGVSFIGATSSANNVSQSGSTVTANIGSLASGASATLTITVVANTGGTLIDTVTTTQTESDTNLANNTASVATLVAQGVDLILTTVANPNPVTVGSPVAIMFTVTNSSTTTGAGVVNLTAPIPAGATIVSATTTQGSTSTANNQLTAAFGTLAAGASATVTLVLNPTTTGTLTTPATVTSAVPDVNPATNIAASVVTVNAAPTTPPIGTDGPRVLGVDRSGFHAQTSNILVTFDGPLDVATAQSLSNYQLVFAGKDGRFGTKDDQTIALSSATYDATAHTVSLHTRKPYSLHKNVQLTVSGTPPNAVRGANGQLLDGEDTGTPGSNFVTVFKGVGPGRISVTSFKGKILAAAFRKRTK
ncbi:MAG: Cna domain protein [Planctomycetota bacterium]|nr:Cna domain protein [Planctomycetota bacterium]